jgi:hypothetical protein
MGGWRVKRVQTWEHGPPSAPAEISYCINCRKTVPALSNTITTNNSLNTQWTQCKDEEDMVKNTFDLENEKYNTDRLCNLKVFPKN